MNSALLYALTGGGLFCLGLYALMAQSHLLKKVLALNVMGNGVFLVLIAVAAGGPHDVADPVPHAMVLTGIVVAISATALALTLAGRLQAASGRPELGEGEDVGPGPR